MKPNPTPNTHPNGDHAQLNAHFQQIHALIHQNEYEQALKLADELIEHPVGARPARALCGLAHAMKGDNARALDCLKEFESPAGIQQHEMLLCIGSAWFKLEHVRRALAFLEQAFRIKPEHPLIIARLGAAYLSAGRMEDAMPLLLKAAQTITDNAGVWINLARAHLELQQYAPCLEALEKAAAMPDQDSSLYWMTKADCLSRQQKVDEALNVLREAHSRRIPGVTQALVGLLATQGQHDEAWTLLREELEQHPDQLELLQLAAELATVRGRYGEANRFLEKALELSPENPALWRQRAMLAGQRLDPSLGRIAADKALALTEAAGGIPHALALNAHAHVLVEELKHAEAEQAYQQALAIEPKCIPALNGMGNLLLQLGRMEEALACFERVKTLAPMQGWSHLIHAREVPEDESVLHAMEQAAHRPSMEGPVQSHMLFTLAAAWEKKKDHERAWAFAVKGNEAAKARLPYRPEMHRIKVERIMARFSPEFVRSRHDFGLSSPMPTFVLGMPRSGTTLVEQILGSHSKVFGAGELSLVPDLIHKLGIWEAKLGSFREYPECLDDMTLEESVKFAQKHLENLQAYAPDALRIVDKLPHNFENIGLIKLIFPQAKILHLRREPRDVAISNYFTDYAAKFGGMGFAYDLSWIGEQLVDHQRLMDHWHRVFPGQILEVDYDSLVEDVSGWAHRIIDYLELPWEDGVLDFQELDRAVKTASVWQVRQPVYTSSKEKWKRYQSHLGPLEAALAESVPPPAAMPLPRLEPGLFLKGMAALQAGEPGQAEQHFRQLLQARPAHAAAHHFLGAALYQQGRKPEARQEMKRSLEIMPRQPQWLENAANVEASLGHADVAQQLRARAQAILQKGPNDEPTRPASGEAVIAPA